MKIKPITLDGLPHGGLYLLLRHFKERFFVYLFGTLFLIGTNLTEVIIPKIIQYLIDILNQKAVPPMIEGIAPSILPIRSPEEAIYILFYFLVFFYFLQLITRFGWRLTLGKETHIASAWLKSFIWNRTRYFPLLDFQKEMNPGHLMNVATSDIGTARFAYGWSILGSLNSIFLGALGLGFMFSIDFEISLLSLVFYLVLPVFIFKLAKLYETYYRQSQEKMSVLSELAAQTISTIKMQRLNNSGIFWWKKLIQISKDYRDKKLTATQTNLCFILVLGLSPITSYFFLFLLGISKVLHGKLSIGEFVALQSYIYILQIPMQDIGFLISEWQRSFTSLDRIHSVFRNPPDPLVQPSTKKHNIAETDTIYDILNLSYSYPETNVKILDNFQLRIQKGEKIGITGEIGAGKSTLLNLVSGIENDFQGQVHLFEKDIRSYNREDISKYISIVPQRAFLFADSVKNNIQLDLDLHDSEIYRLLEICDLNKDIKFFKNGIHTQLGEWGVNLSGGQKQRLNIARALARNPQVLLLDDCLSAVDTVTETNIVSHLRQEFKDLTILWVAHRDSSLKYCDRIIRL